MFIGSIPKLLGYLLAVRQHYKLPLIEISRENSPSSRATNALNNHCCLSSGEYKNLSFVLIRTGM